MCQAHAASRLRADPGRDQDMCRVGAQTGEKHQNNTTKQLDYSLILETYDCCLLCLRLISKVF